MSIDYAKTLRIARRLARDADVLDPENLAGDMVEEVFRAVQAGRFAAPSMRALVIARRICLGPLRFADRSTPVREVDANAADPSESPEEVTITRLTLARVQAAWPMLSETERQAMGLFLAGEFAPERRRQQSLYNARQRAISKLRGVAA
jgi:DNA-directed RNA polymerase specialized sigma24 family protein